MAKLDTSVLTPPNGAVQSVKELMFLKIFTEENPLSKFVTSHLDVENGKKLGGVGSIGPLGRKTTTICGGTYGSTLINAVEKEWKIGKWEILEKLCVDDLIETLIQKSLKSGTAIADLTGTDYMDAVIVPAVEQAIVEMMWRMVWLGDSEAKNVEDGGLITAGVDVALFTTCDGLFKHLAAIVAENPTQRVTITANTKTTTAEQMAAINEPGAAKKIIRDMIDAMPAVLKQQEDRGIIITDTLAIALSRDISDNNKGSELQWQSIFEGVEVAKYEGHNLYRIAMLDQMIQAYNSKGTAIVNPHRAIATTLSNLYMGTSSTQEMAELDVWFEKKEDVNYLKVRDTLGTLVWQDDLVVYGY